MYTTDVLVTAVAGTALIRSGWIIQTSEGFPASPLAILRPVAHLQTIPILSSVALIDDLPEKGFERGQIGTVVEHLHRDNEEAVLVEFSNEMGETCVIADLMASQLLVLHNKLSAA